MKCRFSGDQIPVIHSFGMQPLANGFLKERNVKNEYFFDFWFLKFKYLELELRLSLILSELIIFFIWDTDLVITSELSINMA